VKTPDTVSPRVPAPWRSAQGEAGPKARPQRRSRWRAGEDSGPARDPVKRRGTVERSGGGHADRPFKAVGLQVREPSTRRRGDPKPSPVESTREKSPSGRVAGVRTANRHRWARRAASGGRVKPGQGTRHTDPVTSEEGMLGVREGVHPPSGTESQRIGPSDCLAKTQVRAKPRKAPYTH
jgi:hypothetical protein